MASSAKESGIDTGLFKNQVPDIFLCKICHKVPRYPMKVESCSHIFCKDCFHPHRTLAVRNSEPLLCPVDRSKIEFHNVIYDEQTEMFIGNLAVNCANESRGCDWEGPYKSLDEHLKTCEKKDNMEEVLRRFMKMEERTIKMEERTVKNEERTVKMEERTVKNEERTMKMEEKMVEKDREINYLKNNNEVLFSYDLRHQVRKQKEENESLQLKLYELTRATEDETGELKEEVNNLKTEIEQQKDEIKELKEKQKEMPCRLEELEPSKVYLDLTVDKKPIGRLIIELHLDDAPKTCRKFIQLITHRPGWGYKQVQVGYVGSTAFGFGGGVIRDAKLAGFSTDEYETSTEDAKLKHDKGAVTMAVSSGRTGSVVHIYCTQDQSFDSQKAVIIGHVTSESWGVAESIWKVPIKHGCIPQKEIVISDCGVVN